MVRTGIKMEAVMSHVVQGMQRNSRAILGVDCCESVIRKIVTASGKMEIRAVL